MKNLTVTTIDKALKSSPWGDGGNYFHLDAELLAIVEEATKRGYIIRLSHTQAQWTEEGLAKARRELVDLVIKKTQKGSEFIYEVFNNGEKIGQRKSARTYVATVVKIGDNDGTPFIWGTWFGRLDLIGKGDSRHVVGKPGFHIAYLENN